MAVKMRCASEQSGQTAGEGQMVSSSFTPSPSGHCGRQNALCQANKVVRRRVRANEAGLLQLRRARRDLNDFDEPASVFGTRDLTDFVSSKNAIAIPGDEVIAKIE